MTFRQYLEALGDEKAAVRFGISPRVAKSYRLGERRPRPKLARQMVRRSRGALTLESIYA